MHLCNSIWMNVSLVFNRAHILAMAFSRPCMNKRRKSGCCVASAVVLEAAVPDQNKCVLCNTMQQDHKLNKSKWLRLALLEAPSVAEWLILSLAAFQALERDIPPTYVVSAANHPLSSSGYWAPSSRLSHFSSMYLRFKSACDFLIWTDSSTAETGIVPSMADCYTGWGYTGYELFIWFSALWILVFCYLCLYWYQIPQAISSDLRCWSTHHKMPLHLIFWPHTKGYEHRPIHDSKVWFSQNAVGTFSLTRPLWAVDSALI